MQHSFPFVPPLSRFAYALVLCAGPFSLLGMTSIYAAPPTQTDPVIIEERTSGGEKDAASFAEVAHPTPEDAVETLDMFLRRFPGIQLRGESGWGREVGVSLRGTDNQQTLFFLDNIPLNTALGGGVDLSLFQLANVERIEVYRGGSALFGANAIGGALRMVSKDAPLEPEGSFSTLLGSFGKFSLAGFYGQRWGPMGVTASVGLEQSGGAFSFVDSNGVERVRENNDRTLVSTSARVSYKTGGGRISLTERIVLSDRGAPGVEQFPTTAARLNESRNMAAVDFQVHSLWGGDFSLEGSTWHQLRHMEYEDPDPYLPPPTANRIEEHVVGGYLEASWWGSSWFSARARVEPTGEWAEIHRNDVSQNPSRFRLGGVFSADVQKEDGSLLLTGVVRGDYNSGGAFNGIWKVGLLGEPHENVTIRLNAGRAYRPPSFEELYYDAGAIQGNPDLHAERALSIDGGVEIRWNDLEWKLGGFWLEIDNLILFLPKTAFLVEADDSREARSQGLETSVGWDLSTWMRADASYTFVHAVFKDSGKLLPARSPHLFRLRTEAHWERFALHLQSDWQSGFFLDRFENLSEEGRWRVSGGVRVRPTPWLHIALDGHNLLNKKDAVDGLQFPLPGRSVLLRFTVALRGMRNQ